ncbi:hypothetical protein O6H91_Y411000 [Diphasiastrum complanatum]|nr:hypothetical protein O6H91_Y411000 [Diphasiastrum complanatum]
MSHLYGGTRILRRSRGKEEVRILWQHICLRRFCLMVGWDESASGERQKRVSLWEIEPFTTPFLFCSPALTLRTKRPRTPGAEQAMINGDMEDLTSSVRKSSIWLGGQNMGRIQSMGISSMNPDEWAQMRRPDSVRAAAKPDHHFAVMSAGLQGNCNPEASQQVLFHQNQQRLLSQNVQAGTKLLQQTLPPVIVEQPQHNQQQLHIQEQRKCNSQQHTQPLHHKSLQLEQRIIDARRSFLQCSSNNAQSILEKPVDLSPLRAINSFEAVSPSSTLVKPQGLLSRQHANTLPFIDTTRPLGVPHSNPGLIKDGSGLVPGLAADHLQSAAWFSMETEPIRMHDHLNSNATTAQIEMSANGLPFCVTDSEHVVQTGLFGIISHPSRFNPQEPTHGREHFQSDPRSHLLFGVSIDSPLVGSNTDCVSSVTFPENKNDHRQLGGNEPPCVTVTCSGSEALFNSNSQVSSVLDETVTLESDSNWKQLQPTRTFTKVYKTGSVGRSLDVTCLKNYNELRAEIAHMFGLEGQIEDPRISCWQLVFIDNENDVLLVGDDPWDEFVNCVRCIKVMSPSEVLQMSQDGIELFHSIPAPRPISSNSANNIAQRDMNNTNPTGAPLRSDH